MNCLLLLKAAMLPVTIYILGSIILEANKGVHSTIMVIMMEILAIVNLVLTVIYAEVKP